MKRLLLTVLIAASAQAQDLTGIWVGSIQLGRQGPQDIAFQLVQKGSAISGKLYGDYKSSPIIEGKVENGEINFVVLTQEQAGNQINETRLRFLGCLRSSGELELTRERERSVNAGNSGGVQPPNRAGGVKTTFFIKRLL